MKVSNKDKPEIKEKEIVKEQKSQDCCGPTCCSGTINKKEKARKEK